MVRKYEILLEIITLGDNCRGREEFSVLSSEFGVLGLEVKAELVMCLNLKIPIE
jgi:hypothetical protein